MKRALAAVVLLGLSTPAHAGRRDVWQAAFAGSVTVAVGGMITWWSGAAKVDEAEDELCAGGAYPGCSPARTMLAQEDIDRINAKGDHGAVLSYAGGIVAVVGLGLAGISLYKGFIEEREPSVVIAPTVSPDGAGAALSLRF